MATETTAAEATAAAAAAAILTEITDDRVRMDVHDYMLCCANDFADGIFDCGFDLTEMIKDAMREFSFELVDTWFDLLAMADNIIAEVMATEAEFIALGLVD